jgi:hypothetical protein
MNTKIYRVFWCAEDGWFESPPPDIEGRDRLIASLEADKDVLKVRWETIDKQ